MNFITKIHSLYVLYTGEISLVVDGAWFYPQDPSNTDHRKSAEFALTSTVKV